MSTERYKRINFNNATLDLIDTMNGIVAEYIQQGFRLTVRQLYYQLVARDVVPNTERSYKRITNTANDARVAGLMDWDAIEDRTRSFVRRQRWESGAQILDNAARGFHMDMWENQPARVFCIIEKEALVGVLEPTCRALDVPLLAARGYPSATVLREFAQEDILPSIDNQSIVILHLGDHDPSGMDMTRDLTDRLEMFSRQSVELVRIALNMEQIHERKPPPNPAKTTDSRFQAYRDLYGDESWELDALPPQYLGQLVRSEIEARVDEEAWETRADEVKAIQARITKLAKGFK